MRAALVALVCLASGCNCGGGATSGSGGGAGGSGGSASTGGGAASGGGTASGGGGTTLSDGGALACIPGATALTLTPTQVMAQTLSAIAFTVKATTATGMQDVSGRVACSATRADDTPPGTFAGSSYQPAAAGSATVTCTDGCLTASTTVAITGLTQTFRDPGPAVTGRFGGQPVTGDAMKSPQWVYPHDETRFPRNIYKQLFQWRAQGNEQFKVTFAGPNATVVVYTDGQHPLCAQAAPAAGCYESSVDEWLAIAGGNAGETVTVTVDGVRAGDTKVYRSTALHVGFSKRDVKGAIFYWSTTAAGIRRASVSEAAPEGYVVAKPVATQLAAPGGTVKCVACHTVSRSGKKIIAFSDTSASKGEYVYEVTLQAPPTVMLTTELSTTKGFGTFSPDDKQVVATTGMGLAQFDARTGMKIAPLPPAAATNPDWSPAGDLVAYSNKSGDSPGGAALEVVGLTPPSSWSAPRTLVPAGGKTNLFPSFSPTGAHVAFSQGVKGGHGDKTYQLWIVPSDGGVAVELIRANRHVNNQVTDGQFENNMPTWAPPGDYDWVAFNSARPYGVVVPSGGIQQIWVAAIDRSKLGGAVDPSFPAFRFAFQALNENNHRAYWTLDVRQEADGGMAFDAGPPPDAGMCLKTGDGCDQTSGPLCCNPLDVCDVALADGGATCHQGLQ